MNSDIISCDNCSHEFGVCLPDSVWIKDFRIIEQPYDLGIVGLFRGLSYNRKVYCPECRATIGIVYGKKPFS